MGEDKGAQGRPPALPLAIALGPRKCYHWALQMYNESCVKAPHTLTCMLRLA